MTSRTKTLAAPQPIARKWFVWMPLLVGLALWLATAQAAGIPAAGQVVFVSGAAQLQAADGSRQSVAAGTAVHQGEQITTGDNAYVHVRMIDNAFVAVRP